MDPVERWLLAVVETRGTVTRLPVKPRSAWTRMLKALRLWQLTLRSSARRG